MTTNFKNIGGLQKFSTLDYPNKLSAIIFYQGCNLHCPYCYNDALCKGRTGTIAPEDVDAFLVRRQGKLQGVVFSGGECTLQPNIINDIRRAKELGYLVKIDTNGTRPDVVKQLMDENLLDYVALDVKCTINQFSDYFPINTLYMRFVETLNLLIKGDVEFETRTTVHTKLLDEHDINNILTTLKNSGYKGKHYLQFFFETPDVLKKLGPMPRPFNIAKLETQGIDVEIRNAEGNLCCDESA